MEITNIKGDIVVAVKLDSAGWRGRLVPGRYRLRTRAVDSRGVPGDWSSPEDLDVHTFASKLILPVDGSSAERLPDGRIEFVWQEAVGAARYKIEIRGSNYQIVRTVSARDYKAWLPKGDYTWTVTALLKDGAGGEKSRASAEFKIESDLDQSLTGRFDLSWPKNDQAVAYDIEVSRPNGSVVTLMGTEMNQLSEWFEAGSIRYRIRARDAKGRITAWGGYQDASVLSLKPHMVTPAAGDGVEAPGQSESRVTMKWQPAADAKSYRLEIINVDAKGQPLSNTPVYSDVIDGLEASPKLAVGKAYEWHLTPISREGHALSDRQSRNVFTLYGQELAPPRIDLPKTKYVYELTWDPGDVTKTFDYRLEYYHPRKAEWRKVEEESSLSASKIPFAFNYPGGRYRLSVRAVGEYRKPSIYSTREFEVAGGDRHPEVTYNARLLESVDRPNGLYYQASYFVASVAYSGEDPESNSKISFNALGGTGRLGIGYKPESGHLSYLATADLSGFKISGGNYTFAGMEADIEWTHYYGAFVIRPLGGLFYKELPEVLGQIGQANVSAVDKIAIVGPQVGIEVLRAITPEYGLLMNFHAYAAAASIKTPNGGGIAPSVSYQFGLLASHRLEKGRTGYVGYVYRVDKASYQSTAEGASGPSLTSLAPSGSLQKLSLSGSYLNLMLEW